MTERADHLCPTLSFVPSWQISNATYRSQLRSLNARLLLYTLRSIPKLLKIVGYHVVRVCTTLVDLCNASDAEDRSAQRGTSMVG